jgi:hypothetical protein
MHCSFRPVALRLPLTEVAALAAATARVLFRERPLALAFRLTLQVVSANAQNGWTAARVPLRTQHEGRMKLTIQVAG